MITATYLLVATCTMALVTFMLRAVPLLLPQKLLTAKWFITINQGLPLAVMSLLVLTSLIPHNQTISMILLAKILALFAVLFSYHLYQQLLISIVIGIVSLNGLLWLYDFIMVKLL